MVLSVPDSAKEIIERQAAAAGFPDVAGYILALVEADRSRRIREELEAKVLQGLRSPSTLMEDHEWDDIAREGEKLLAEKKQR